MTGRRMWGLRGLAVLAVSSLATAGLLVTRAGAGSGSIPGVTDEAVTLGYITSETGVASSGLANADKSCIARVDAENAKGGVNGRQSPPRRTFAQHAWQDSNP